jgi:hypothetical protein
MIIIIIKNHSQINLLIMRKPTHMKKKWKKKKKEPVGKKKTLGR